MSSLETVARFRCLREEKAGCFEGKSLPTLIEHLAQHFEKDTGYKGHYEFFCEQCNAGFTNRRYASAHKAEHPNHQVTTSVQTGGPSVNRPDSLQRKIYEKWQLYLDYFVGFAPTMPKSLPRLRQNVPMRVGTVDLEEEAGGPRTPRTSTYDESSTSGRNGDAYAYVPKTPRFNYGGRTPSYGGARTPARSPMRTPTYEDGELPYASGARTPMYEPRTPSRKRSSAIDSNSYVLPPAPKAPSYVPCAPVAVPPPPPPPPMYPGGQVAGSYWNPPAQSGGFPAQTGIPPQMDWNNPFASQYAMQFAQMMGMTPNTTGQPISSLATPPMVPPPTQNTNEMSSSYSSNKYQNSETSSMDQSSDNISFSGGRGRGGFGGRGGSYRGGRGGGFGGGRGGGGWNNNGGQGWKQKQGRFNDDNSANNRSFGGSSRGGRDFGSREGDNKDSFNSSFSVPANREERRDRSYSRSRSGSPVANLQAERNTSSAELPRTVERGSPRRSFERENRSYSRSRSRSVSPAGSAAASPVREPSAEPGPAANENGDDAPRATSPMPLPDNIFSSPARLDMPLNNQTPPPMNMAAYSPATPDYGGPVMEQHTIKKSDSEDNLMHRESSEAESSTITSTQQVRQQAVAKPITASGCYGGGTGVAPKYGQHRAQFIEIDHVPRMDPAEKTSRSADRKRSQRRGRKSSGSGEDELDEPAPEKRRKSSRVARASQGKKEKVVADESPSRSQSRSPSP